MSELVALLDTGSSDKGRFVFPAIGSAVGTRQLWGAAEKAARHLRMNASHGETIGAILTATPDSLALVVGALRAGLSMCSLPTPARGMSIEDYVAQVRHLLKRTHARTLFVDSEYLPIFAGSARSVRSIASIALGRTNGRSDALPDDGVIIQCSSGTTGRPKPIILSQQAVAANITALMNRLELQAGDRSVSWLPLSHDMGLFGFALLPWCAGARDICNGGDAILLPPESFLADPSCWMKSCAKLGATISGAPPFALEMAVAKEHRPGRDSLRRMRALLVGADLIPALTLERFSAAFADSGLDASTITPAYGMAEAALGIAMVRPGDGWSTRVVANEETQRQFVSCGKAVDGMTVTTETEGVGRLIVRGDSLFSGYYAEHQRTADEGLLTGDLGTIAGGEVIPMGRVDDVLMIDGRKVLAQDIEAATQGDGVRSGSPVAFQDDGQITLFCELTKHSESPDRVCELARRRVAQQMGFRVTVCAVQNGVVPKSPSGKLQRHAVRGVAPTMLLGSSGRRRNQPQLATPQEQPTILPPPHRPSAD